MKRVFQNCQWDLLLPEVTNSICVRDEERGCIWVGVSEGFIFRCPGIYTTADPDRENGIFRPFQQLTVKRKK